MFAVHDRVARRDWPATQPRFNRISNRTRKRWAGQRPNCDITNASDRKFADLTNPT
jgi:hypothetical protein